MNFAKLYATFILVAGTIVLNISNLIPIIIAIKIVGPVLTILNQPIITFVMFINKHFLDDMGGVILAFCELVFIGRCASGKMVKKRVFRHDVNRIVGTLNCVHYIC
jgi:hypothetical protein